MSASSSPYVVGLPGGVPSTHREHTESRTTILLPNDNTAFLNPPQQFNRDLSVAVIRAWNEQRIEKAKAKQEANAAKGKGKNKKNKARAAEDAEQGPADTLEGENGNEPVAGPSTEVSVDLHGVKCELICSASSSLGTFASSRRCRQLACGPSGTRKKSRTSRWCSRMTCLLRPAMQCG